MAKEQPITYRLVYLKIDKYKNIEDIEVKFTLDYEIEESIEAAALLIKESVFFDSKINKKNPLAHLDVFTSFVGANGSGKSNLIELISYIFTTGVFPVGLVKDSSESYAIFEQNFNEERSFFLVTPNIELYTERFSATEGVVFCKQLKYEALGKTILYHPLNDLSAGTTSNVIFNSEKIASNPFKKLALGVPDSRLAKQFADNALSLEKFEAFEHISKNEYSRLVLLFSDFKNTVLEDSSFSKQFNIFSKKTAQVKLYNKFIEQLDEDVQPENIFILLYAYFMTLSAVQHNKHYTNVPYLDAFMVSFSLFSEEIEFIQPFIEELEKYVQNQQWEAFREDIKVHVTEFRELMKVFKVEYNELNGSHLSVKLSDVSSENIALDLICSNDWFDLRSQKRAFQGTNIPLKVDGLSSGEITAIHYISELYRKIKQYGHSSLVVLDEPENSFHPEWQRLLISILDEMYQELGVSPQTIISSHSPFILSDTLSGKVVFLGGESGLDNCFAANIHDLLSNGFFLNQTIGNASQKEVIKIIEFINQPLNVLKTNDDTRDKLEMAKLVINQIGDYVLKKELTRKLARLENSLSTIATELTYLLKHSDSNDALKNELRELSRRYSVGKE